MGENKAVLRPFDPPHHTLEEIALQCEGICVEGSSRATLTGLALDTAMTLPGDGFLAVRGTRDHGLTYLDNALEAGAVAILTDIEGMDLLRRRYGPDGVPPSVEVPNLRARIGELSAWFYGEPARSMVKIGVTGTNGKTTISYLAEAALREHYRTTALLGTIEITIAERSVHSERTTLDAPALQAAFAAMREQHVQALAMEVSSHALAQQRVDATTFDVAIFSNLSRDHLDFHKTMENYFDAKASLFAPQRAARAVICIDDEWGEKLAHRTILPTDTVSSKDPDADWLIRDVRSLPGEFGSAFTLLGPEGPVELSVVLPGGYNVMNATLAYVASLRAGVSASEAAAGIAALSHVPGRMQAVRGADQGGPLGIVDFAHTPESVEAALGAVRAIVPEGGRVIAVLGAGGERDDGKRPLMGAAAARGADLVIVTDDNPRSEDPAFIRRAVRRGAEQEAGAEVIETPGRDRAIREAVALARASDIVVLLGKGHETSQRIGERTEHFDDVEQLNRALRGAHDLPDVG